MILRTHVRQNVHLEGGGLLGPSKVTVLASGVTVLVKYKIIVMFWVQAMFCAVAAISFNLGYAWGMHEIQRVVC